MSQGAEEGVRAHGILETKNERVCLGQRVEGMAGNKDARSAGAGRMHNCTTQAGLVSAHMLPLRLLGRREEMCKAVY